MMNLLQLRELAARFANIEIAYADFRQRFIMEALVVHSSDPQFERDVNAIENASAECDEGDVSIEDLRDILSFIASQPVINVRVDSLVLNIPQINSESSSSFYYRAA